MLIDEFRSRLLDRKDQSALFDALGRLRLLDSPERMVANADDDGGDGGSGTTIGWNVWSDATGPDGQGLCAAT